MGTRRHVVGILYGMRENRHVFECVWVWEDPYSIKIQFRISMHEKDKALL
jgi:hypothetical protein